MGVLGQTRWWVVKVVLDGHACGLVHSVIVCAVFQKAWAVVVWDKVAWLRLQVGVAACVKEQEGCLAGIAGRRRAKRQDAVVAS